MADQVPYNEDEYDIHKLRDILQTKNITLNDRPIASGTSVVFKGIDDDKTYAIKYKRDNIDLHIFKSIEEMKLLQYSIYAISK